MGYRRDSDKPETVVTYHGTEVGYYESINKWVFVLRGRERTVESLAQAKEAIDKPVKEKKPEFKPVAAFKFETWGDDKFSPVTITSLIEGGNCVWIQSKDSGYRTNGRTKEQADKIYLNTPENALLIEAWKELNTQKTDIEKKMSKLITSMETAAKLAEELPE